MVAVEGINQIKTKELVSLSEQELIDCDTSENQGCNGGLMDLAFDFIKKTGGLTKEDYYPYAAADGRCDSKKVHLFKQNIGNTSRSWVTGQNRYFLAQVKKGQQEH